MFSGEDIGTMPARSVCFKRVDIKDFTIFNTSTLHCLSKRYKLLPIVCSDELEFNEMSIIFILYKMTKCKVVLD